jgi:arginase
MAKQKELSCLGIPINCVGVPGGTEQSPAVLREFGIVDALMMLDLGDLPVRIDSNIRDPNSGFVGFESVCRTSASIRERVRELISMGKKPALIGGCCTEVLGALAGAKDYLGDVGLAYLDGHIDLYDGRTSPTGEAADMPIAVLLGHGPEPLMEALGSVPVLKPDHLALLGYRDLDEAASRGSLVPDDFTPAMMHYDVTAIRSIGPAIVGERTESKLASQPGRYWLHLDFDVLDQFVFPATDYLMPDGLTWHELIQLMTPIANSPALVGISIACYNPDKDPHREGAQTIVAFLQKVFSQEN